jgi:hypothetical protein
MRRPLGEWLPVAASDSLGPDLLIGVLAGLLTLLLVHTGTTLARISRARRGHLAGIWYQTSPDPRGVQEVLRVDQVHLHTAGSRIRGYVNRHTPAEERPKQWRFRGRVSGPLISGYFWTTDIHSNPRSCGTFHLQMVDPFLWVGRYTTVVGTVDPRRPSSDTQELKDLPLEWNREPPRRRPDVPDDEEPA